MATRIVSVMFVWLLAFSSFAQSTVDVSVLLDDPVQAGCDVIPGGALPTLPGIDARLTATVDSSTNQVTNVDLSLCSGGSFGPATSVGGGQPVGENIGIGGADVVELSVDRSLIGTNALSLRVIAMADNTFGVDITAAGALAAIAEAIAVPGLSLTSLLLLSVLLVTATWFTLKRNRIPITLTLLGVSFTVWAMNFIVDGQIGDWTGISPAASDPTGDATNAQTPADIVALFASEEDKGTGPQLFFRVDMADLAIVNQSPIANDDADSTDEDAAITTINVLANDTDADAADVLSVQSADAISANGAAITDNGNGTFGYDPTASASLNALAAGETSVDTFIYTVTDGSATDTGTVTITVTGINDAPNAVNDNYATGEDTPLALAAPGVLANDTDPDTSNSLAAVLDSAPANALSFTLNADGSFSYTPAANFSGADPFTYHINDGVADSNIATGTITVGALNDAPVANNDGGNATDEDSAITTTNVLSNDTDADLDTLSVASVDAVSAMSATISDNGDGTFAYDPSGSAILGALATGESGVDTFSYVVTDGLATDTATVSVDITGVNDPLVANTDSFSTDEDTPLVTSSVLANDTDPDTSDVLSVQAADAVSAQGITITNNGDGTFAYDPTSSIIMQALPTGATVADTFSYTVIDGNGSTGIATVTINVTGINDAPVIAFPTAGILFDNTTPVNLDPLATLTDVDSTDFDTGELTVSVALNADPSMCDVDDTLAVENQGAGVTQIGFDGTSVSYEGTQFGTVTSDYLCTDIGGGAFLITPLLLTMDPNASQAAVTALLGALQYSTISADDQNREASAMVSDGDGATSGVVPQIISLTLNQAPTITTGNAVSVEENQTAVIDVDSTDPDGDSEGTGLTYMLSGGADQALFAIDTNTGVLTFLAPPDFEAPSDSDTDNIYDVQVTVTDSGIPVATDVLDLIVTVTDVINDATIIVELQTLPDGASSLFDFTGDVTGTISDNGNITVNNLAPGTYTSTEADPTPAFDLSNLTCDDLNSTGDVGTRTATFNVEPGETVTCVFTNTQRGAIIVEKQTLTDGAAGSFNFTGDAAGTISDNGSITVNNLAPGTYTSTETPLAGFDLTDITCDDSASSTPSTGSIGTGNATFNVEPGETVTCVFTNTQRGTITIVKDANPNGPTDFSFTDDVAAPNAFNLDDDADGTLSNTMTFTNVVPGTYSVTETLPNAGFDLTGLTCTDSDAGGTASTSVVATGIATINLDPGETVTCTYINTERGTINIVKDADPNGPTDFAFTDDITAPNAFSLDDDTDPTLFDTMTFTNVIPGTYTVTEADPTPSFDLSALVCVDSAAGTVSAGSLVTRAATINLDPGETVTCTFTNTERGSITIIKDVVPDDPQDFTFTDDMEAPNTFDLDDDADGTLSNTKVFSNVVPGTFTVIESDPTPANLSGIVCDDGGSATASMVNVPTRTATINLDPGESVTCTFTNSFNTAPEITSNGGLATAAVNVAENQAAVTDVQTTDDNDSEGSGLTYSKTTIGGGGSDNPFFTLDASTGVLTFTVAPNFEAMIDANGDNDYEVQVTVTDSGRGTPLIDVQDITVTVTDVNEAPTITSSASQTGPENQTAVATLAATDVDMPAQTLTWTETGGADGSKLSITPGGVLSFDATPNFEIPSDANTDGTYEIQVTVTDNGAGNLTNVQTVSVTVTNVNEAPTAVNDAYTGQPVNVLLDAGAVTASGVEVNDADGALTKGTNDSDPDGDTLIVSGITGCADVTPPFTDCATTGGGLVTVNSDGTFTYVSELGETAASDTFTYTLSDGALTDTATVTITLGDTIWFIDDVTGGGNNGRSSSPFETVGAFNAATTGTGDTIFVHPGTFSDAGIALLNDQLLVGERSGLTSGGLTIPVGTPPVLSPSTGNGVNLASGNTVRGLNIGNTPGGYAFSGSAVGTPTIDTVTISGSGGIMNINGGNLANVTLGNSVSTNAPASGFLLQNLTGTFNPGGTVEIASSAGIAVRLTNNSGATITLADLDINNSATNQPGIVGTGGGLLRVSTGTVNGGTATAVDINGLTLSVMLVRVDSVGGTTPGIDLAFTTGTFTVTGVGTIDDSGGTISGKATSDAVNLLNTGGLITLNNMTITDIGSTSGGFNTRSNHDAIHGQNVNAGLSINNMTVDNISDNFISGSALADGLTATTFAGLTVSNSAISDTNRFHVANVADGQDEGAIRIVGLSGTVNISNNTFDRGNEFLDIFSATSGSLAMTVDGNVFTDAYQEYTSGLTAKIGLICVDVTVRGSTTTTVNIINNTFTNCSIASVRVVTESALVSASVTSTISDNKFLVTDHSSTLGTAGNFPQGGLALRHLGSGAFDANVTNNDFGSWNGATTSDWVMNADGGVGALTIIGEGGTMRVEANLNDFNSPINSPFFVRADASSAFVYLHDNIYRSQFGFFSPDPFFGSFTAPGIAHTVAGQNSALLNFTLSNEALSVHDESFDGQDTLQVRAQTSSTVCASFTNVTTGLAGANGDIHLNNTASTLNRHDGGGNDPFQTTGTIGTVGSCSLP